MMEIPTYLKSAFTRNKHPYLMRDGIQKIPHAINDIMMNIDIQGIIDLVKNRNKYYLVGCGTSLFAAQAATYAFQSVTKATAVALNAFEFNAYPPRDLEDCAVIGISHSGGTPVTYDSMKMAKSKNIPVIGITDKKGSVLEETADLCLITSLGTEPALPKTWSYIASLVRLYLISLAKSKSEGSDIQSFIQQLKSMVKTSQQLIEQLEPEIQSFANSQSDHKHFAISGGGPLLSTANEGALKLTEAALVHSIGWEIEEAAHGAWVSTGENDWVVVNAVQGPSMEKALKLAEGMKAIDAKVWVITNQPYRFRGVDRITGLPDQYSEWLMPVLTIIPLYLFTYYLSLSCGINPDIMRLDDQRYMNARQVMRQTIKY